MLVSDMVAVIHLSVQLPHTPLVINVTVTDVLKQTGHSQKLMPSTLLSGGCGGMSLFNQGAWYLRKRQLQHFATGGGLENL